MLIEPDKVGTSGQSATPQGAPENPIAGEMPDMTAQPNKPPEPLARGHRSYGSKGCWTVSGDARHLPSDAWPL